MQNSQAISCKMIMEETHIKDISNQSLPVSEKLEFCAWEVLRCSVMDSNNDPFYTIFKILLLLFFNIYLYWRLSEEKCELSCKNPRSMWSVVGAFFSFLTKENLMLNWII